MAKKERQNNNEPLSSFKIDYTKFGFLPYQVAWLQDNSQIKIYEKSRRIGMTYAQAFEDVIDAAVFGKYNVWFSSNNITNAREYIDYCKNMLPPSTPLSSPKRKLNFLTKPMQTPSSSHSAMAKNHGAFVQSQPAPR